ncbi:MAG: hypothetical protein KKD21_13985 [Proteobacteria bacterium]|nr:hypothetical protein [Pseudomonadota bacterium]MBU1698129.1 hypothetical protein [Pseudomonadota bacterium]
MSDSKPLPAGVILQRDKETFELTQQFLTFYSEKAPQKQRTAHFIEKIGIETVKAELGLA